MSNSLVPIGGDYLRLETGKRFFKATPRSGPELKLLISWLRIPLFPEESENDKSLYSSCYSFSTSSHLICCYPLAET